MRISRPRGLSLSAAGAESMSLLSPQDAEAATRPGFVQLTPPPTLTEARDRINRQMREIATAPEVTRNTERVALVRMYLSLGMGAEALGVLDMAGEADSSLTATSRFRALRSVALLQLHRPREALEEMKGFDLSQSTDTALWRGEAYAQLGQWDKAAESFGTGKPALSSYPPEQQSQFLLDEAEAALDLGDAGNATSALDQAKDVGHGSDERRLRFLEGRLAELNGDDNRAMAAYDIVADGKLPRDAVGAGAELRRILLGLEMGEMDEDKAIAALESLTMSWRGDETEYLASRKLANLYADKGEYRRAFELMRTAILAEPSSPSTKGLQDDMTDVFEKLFLGGKTDGMPTVDALALYYDFKEMTPIGRKGDEMIRALADRLVSLDLLDQAADLLDYQINNRLNGAARAQVAARLAAVQLMAKRPAEALKVLTNTRQAHLPPEIEDERTLLEARALGQTGRTELALGLLSALPENSQVSRTRASILWAAERWQGAGEEIERLLGDSWNGGAPLDDATRNDVLRAGIAYALAGDRLGTQRLRSKYLDKMASSADAHAFDVVTQPAAAAEGELDKVVASLAKTDDLRAFMKEYSAQAKVSANATPEG